MIEDHYPPDSWIHVFTDGSATQAVKDGGAGIYIKFPDGQTQKVHCATGKYCSNYRAEVEALTRAAGIVARQASDCPQVVILTDALCVLEALDHNKLEDLGLSLQSLCGKACGARVGPLPLWKTRQ